MILRIFFIEFKRSLKITLTLILCSLLFGFTFSSAFKLKKYIETLFVPVSWGAGLIIVPKGVSLEGLHRSLIHGEPEGLIPMALFETLEGQINDEKNLRHLSVPSLKVLGIIPFKNESKTNLAFIGDQNAYFSTIHEPSIWNQFSFKPWATQSSDLANRAGYQTPEWGHRVLMGILAQGEPGPLQKLKELIDRKTIAQALLANPGQTDADHRIDQLGKSLYVLVTLIAFCLLPGLFLSILILRERRSKIYTVMQELGWTSTRQLQLFTLQLLVLVLGPLMMGAFWGTVFSPWLQQILKVS